MVASSEAEEVELVDAGDGDGVREGVPGEMEHALAEIDRVRRGLRRLSLARFEKKEGEKE